MAEYVDPKGGSFSESHRKRNPLLMAQSVSSTPLGAHSPMKDFGIISGPIIAALAAAAKAAAATKVGAAVVGAAKAVGAKLAATKVGGAVIKGAKFVGKGIKAIKGTKVVKGIKKGVDAVKKFTGKITGKAKIGPKASGEGTGMANLTDSYTSTESLGQRGISSLQQEDKQKKAGAMAGHQQRAAGHYASLPTFGSSGSNVPRVGEEEGGEETELGSSVLTYKTPFRLRSGNSPLFKRMGSPFRGKSKKAKYDAALGSYSDQTKGMAKGSGFGVDPVSFTKTDTLVHQK